MQVGDIDAVNQRVHIRNAKGNKDRLVPLPDMTYQVLRCFWSIHRHPTFIFPNRKHGLKNAQLATTPLDRGGIQTTMAAVIRDMGLKKRFLATLCATAMPRIC